MLVSSTECNIRQLQIYHLTEKHLSVNHDRTNKPFCLLMFCRLIGADL